MGRRGPAAICTTRAEKNAARRDRYRQRRRSDLLPSQESHSSVSQVLGAQPGQVIQDPQEPTPDINPSSQSESALAREATPDTLDARPRNDPRPLPEDSLPLFDEIGSVADGSRVFDIDGEDIQHHEESVFNHHPSTDAIS